MRSVLQVCAATAFVLTGLTLSQRAEAMPIAPAAGLASDAGLVTTVQYGCPPVWRCGPWGCGWRRVCWGGPYPYYGYGYRPYWRYGYRPWGYRGWGYRGWGYRHHW